MSCKQLKECLDNLKWDETALQQTPDPQNKAQREKIKGKYQKIQQEHQTLTGNPCKNAEKLKKCVAYAGQRSLMNCKENGKCYTLDVDGNYFDGFCIHVDGGIIDKDDSRSRCDFALFLNDHCDEGKGRAIFIELKGSDTKKALKQLKETMQMDEFKDIHRDYRKAYGRIVCSSSVPRIQNTGEYMDLKEYLKRHGGNLKTKEFSFIEHYAEIDK